MDKEQIAYDLTLIAVKSRLDDHKAENKEIGLNNYADQIVEDYKYLFKRIKDNLD